MRDADGITPLHSAAHNGKFESLLLLLHFEGDDDTEENDESGTETEEAGNSTTAATQSRSTSTEPSIVKAKKPYARVGVPNWSFQLRLTHTNGRNALKWMHVTDGETRVRFMTLTLVCIVLTLSVQRCIRPS